MDNILITSITTALSIGLSCGTGCSPIITTFLTTYAVSHSDGIKKAIKYFGSFFLGKVLSVIFLCVLSSAISKNFIDENGFIGSFNLRFAAQIFMSAIGIIMVIRWFLENNKKIKCDECHGCKKKIKEKKGVLPMLFAGITYGFTPCAPLLLIIGYTFTLPIMFAGITGVVFGISSIISPIILLAIITGVLSKKIQKEIPYCLKWFRLASYFLLIVLPFFIH